MGHIQNETPPKRPNKAFQSINERTDKMWFIHKVEYDLALKRNESGSCAQMWIDLESVTQGEVKSEREKQISYINPYMWNQEK